MRTRLIGLGGWDLCTGELYDLVNINSGCMRNGSSILFMTLHPNVLFRVDARVSLAFSGLFSVSKLLIPDISKRNLSTLKLLLSVNYRSLIHKIAIFY